MGTPINVVCSTRRNFSRLSRAMTVPPAPVSTSNDAVTRLMSTSMTKRFGSLSRVFRLSFTTSKPSCFKKLFSVVEVFAVCFSESLGIVIKGDVGNGVGVRSGFCATELGLGESTVDGATACAAAIWIPHIATAIQVDMCSSFVEDPLRLKANRGMYSGCSIRSPIRTPRILIPVFPHRERDKLPQGVMARTLKSLRKGPLASPIG